MNGAEAAMKRFWTTAAATALLVFASGASAAPKTLELVDKLAGRVAAVPAEKAQTAYLFVYFKDETHAVYFATSTDGYTFTDVNGGEPIFTGAQLADQKGVRDPYILRGPDGAFYLAMTDLHIYAQREGLRTTQWERPQAEWGWGNNKNLILMKSYDLIHWTHARVTPDDLFDEVKDLSAAWAPELIWDPAVGKLMVYYTTRVHNDPAYLVYSYADPAFTTLTTTPKRLFDYPTKGKAAIDADITKVGIKYRMFYVTDEAPGNIRQAVSDRLTGGYVFDPTKVDPETVHAEAPNVWRRHGTGIYVLMYDAFGAKPKNNMGFSETTDFVHFKNLGRFNEPDSPMKATNFESPKHGAVIAVTPAEVERLRGWFGGK